VNALQSEAICPEERALPRFSRRALKRLPAWDLWHKNELEQLDQMKALGMFGAPIKLPEVGILMRFHWQCRIKVLDCAAMDHCERHRKHILQRTLAHHAWNIQCFDCSMFHAQRTISLSVAAMPRMHSLIHLGRQCLRS